MNICANCFNDEEIKQFIITSSTARTECDCCGQECETIDLNEISDFFIEFLGLFVKDSNGTELVQLIQKDWNIFYSDVCARKILSAIIDHEHFDFSVDDKVLYTSEVQECFSVWEKLKSEVQEEKRYFSDLGSFNWEVYIKSNAQIRKGTILYRARITPDGRNKLKTSEMIGKFTVRRDLNIVDFSNKISLFFTYTDSESNFSLEDIAKRKILFDKISADLSKPLRRFDTEIEYVPTQLICEYCKQNGADGIRFNSSLHQGGTNVVLFNSLDATCTSVLHHEIKSVIIES